MTPEELAEARAANKRVRRGPMVSGMVAARVNDILLDKIEEAIGVIDQLKENALAAHTRADRAETQIQHLEGLVEGHTMRGDDANLARIQVTKWAADQTDFSPDEVGDLAKAAYPDMMSVLGWGIPLVDIDCPKCEGPARYLVNVETGTTFVCPKCSHAWIPTKDPTP